MSGKQPDGGLRRFGGYVSPRRISAVYVLIAIIVLFTIWVPASFPTSATLTQVLNSSAITGLVATGLVLPLASGVFDVSVAYTMTLTGVLAADLVTNAGMSVGLAVGISLAAGLAVGVINSVIVVVLRINSFIGTLAMGLIIEALVTMISGGNTISGVSLEGTFTNLSQTSLGTITIPVFLWLALVVVVYVGLDFTVLGRRLYATGFNPVAARLVSIRVRKYQACTLMISSLVAGAAGILLASSISSGDPSAGDPYLLPAYGAVFLGATQFKDGRFNPWGTALATLLVGTGIVGLGLAAAPAWAASLFSGVVLLGALAVFEQRAHGGWRLLRNQKGSAPDISASDIADELDDSADPEAISEPSL